MVFRPDDHPTLPQAHPDAEDPSTICRGWRSVRCGSGGEWAPSDGLQGVRHSDCRGPGSRRLPWAGGVNVYDPHDMDAEERAKRLEAAYSGPLFSGVPRQRICPGCGEDSPAKSPTSALLLALTDVTFGALSSPGQLRQAEAQWTLRLRGLRRRVGPAADSYKGSPMRRDALVAELSPVVHRPPTKPPSPLPALARAR